MASQEGIAGQFCEGARGARPARLAADRSRWLPRPGARSPAECLGTAYRTSAAPLTICRMVSVIRALGIPVQTHHSRPHFARATWQPGPARRSRRGANAPGWKTFSKRTRSVLAEPARSNPKPGKGSSADAAPPGSPFSQHRTGIDAGRRSRGRSRPYNGLASRLVHEQNLRGVSCFTHPPT